MKKNSKGFVLIETLIASTFILGTLVFLYIQFSNVKRAYDVSFDYNSIPNLYSAKTLEQYIKEQGYQNIINQIDENEYGFVDISSCLEFNSYCKPLLEALNINQIIMTKNDISSLQNNLNSTNFSSTFKNFIKKIDSKTINNKYRLIINFKNETFASITIGDDTSTPVCNLKDGESLKIGSKYECTIGTSTEDFYVLNSDVSRVELIMNKNYTDDVINTTNWCNSDNCSKNELNTYLEHLKTLWPNVFDVTLPTADEIALTSDIKNLKESDEIPLNSFLYENLNQSGYWTETFNSQGKAWYVDSSGELKSSLTNNKYGIRPVITISKSLIN